MQDDTSTFFCLTEIRITSRYREMIQNEYNKNFILVTLRISSDSSNKLSQQLEI